MFSLFSNSGGREKGKKEGEVLGKSEGEIPLLLLDQQKSGIQYQVLIRMFASLVGMEMKSGKLIRRLGSFVVHSVYKSPM